MKWKAFFIISKGLSIKQITQIFLEGENPTLKETPALGFFCKYYKFFKNTYSEEHLLTTAFAYILSNTLLIQSFQTHETHYIVYI